MVAPHYAPEEDEPERPWMGMALLLSVPLLSLILIRLLWSGSGLWYLLVGILFLGVSAALFLARRNDERGPTTLADEPNRLPLVLMGIGMAFVVLLLVPNFSSGDADDGPVEQAQEQPASPTSSQAAVAAQPTTVRVPTAIPGQQSTTAAPDEDSQVELQEAPDETEEVAEPEEEIDVAPPAGSETYVVSDGDTLWAIATEFGVSVDEIVSANQLESEDDIQVGEEIAIPPTSEDSAEDAEG